MEMGFHCFKSNHIHTYSHHVHTFHTMCKMQISNIKVWKLCETFHIQECKTIISLYEDNATGEQMSGQHTV